ncbi:MAG: sugar ABC transporter permease [Clostridia bacterium]|jgi:multiple sugar transport system permease protein|nr:sugar ABC transporter permease [Clostridia bacterium]
MTILKRKGRQVFWFYIFMLPALIGFTGLALYPFFRALFISFTNRTLLGFDETQWVGFANYLRAFKDPYVWESLGTSMIFAVFSVIITNVMGLLVALLLTSKHPFIKGFRIIYYIPSIIPGVASVIAFGFIFSPSQGVINIMLRGLGIENPPMWLSSTKTALPTMILMGLWAFGGKMVIFLAGLLGISRDYYEAASLEGANGWQMFWHVTFPQMTRVIFYNVMMSIIGSIQIFTEAYVISGTGVGVPVNFYMVNLYSHAYSGEFQLGYASALAWILFVVIMVITGLYNLINKRFFDYDI